MKKPPGRPIQFQVVDEMSLLCSNLSDGCDPAALSRIIEMAEKALHESTTDGLLRQSTVLTFSVRALLPLLARLEHPDAIEMLTGSSLVTGDMSQGTFLLPESLFQMMSRNSAPAVARLILSQFQSTGMSPSDRSRLEGMIGTSCAAPALREAREGSSEAVVTLMLEGMVDADTQL